MARRRSSWSQTREAGAYKWGTGINPVHSIPYGDEGRNINVNLTAGGPVSIETATPGFAPVPIEMTDSYWYLDSAAEDSPWVGIPAEFDSAIEGTANLTGIEQYGDANGTADRPDLGVETQQFRGSSVLFRGMRWPAWGRYKDGVPGGTTIRSADHGAMRSKLPKEVPTEDVAQGWLNKETGDELLAHVSDPSQLIMQTSMTQRFAVRKGSQRGEGSQSVQEPAHAIHSRVVGMKEKHYSGEQRHYDMLPKQQDEFVRPWWSRSAGTASPQYLEPNDARSVTPMMRNPPEDPYQGIDQPSSNLYGTYGYTGEDVLPYV